MSRISLLILGDVAEMSPNRKCHYRERDRLRDKWKLLTLDAWNRTPGAFMFGQPVRISYRVFRGRQMDLDNLCSSGCFKAVQDALKGRAYPDDSPRYVHRGDLSQETGERYRKHPAVEVIIEEVD